MIYRTKLFVTPLNYKVLFFFSIHEVILILVFGILCFSVKAQNTFSPQLNQFLESHPQASGVLSNEMARVRGLLGNRIEIFYFYNYDDALATVYHNMFEDGPGAALFIRGGRQVTDEYLDILFEILNTSGDKRFKQLYQQAKMDNISRTNFVTEMLRQEFQAVTGLKNLIPALELSPEEIANSKVYTDLSNTPNNLNEFIAYINRSSPGHVRQRYEQYYDDFHNKLIKPNIPTASEAGQ